MYILQSKDDMMPDWLKENLHAKCKYCGSEMENFYNDENGRCTGRRCSNHLCYGMQAAKANFISELTKVKGVGFATFLDVAIANNTKHHIPLFNKVCGKVKMNLSTFLRSMCFPGVDGEWSKICASLDLQTIDELYEKYDGQLKDILLSNKELIEEMSEYVELEVPISNSKKNDCIATITVMITGNVDEFPSKEHFIAAVNAAANGYIRVVHQETKRQTGVDFLIKEEHTKTKGKVEAAIKGGIPIVTSAQFVNILNGMIIKHKTAMEKGKE